MRISSSTFTNNLVNQLNNLNYKQNKLQQELASGQVVQRPSDNPEAGSRTMLAESEKRELAQLRNNSLNTETMLKVGVEGLQYISDMTQLIENTVSPGELVTDARERDSYINELNQYLEDVLDMANGKYRDEYIHGGMNTDTPPFTAERDANGNITAISYNGSQDADGNDTNGRNVPVSPGVEISPFSDAGTNRELEAFMNAAIDLRDAQETQDQAAVIDALEALRSADLGITSGISDMSIRTVRLDTLRTRDDSRYTGLQDQISRNIDADTTQVTVELMHTQNAYQAALQSASRIMRTSLLSYI